ncbi:MAG: hypothetical protein E7B29_22450 [Mixta calida]|nr:hypothetical protein [Mixta calida]
MGKVTWYDKEKGMNKKILSGSTVREDTYAAAQMLLAVFEARLAPHHANNAHNPGPHSYMDVTRGKVDAFVNLNDADGGAAGIGYKLGIFEPWAWEGSAGRTPGAD